MNIHDKDGAILRGCEAIANSKKWKGRPNLFRGNRVNRTEVFRLLVIEELKRLQLKMPGEYTIEGLEAKIEKYQKAIDLAYETMPGSVPRLEAEQLNLKAKLQELKETTEIS